MSGNGPPPDYDPTALVAAIRQRPRPSKIVEFPAESAKGTPFEQIRIVVQSAAQHRDAQLAAHNRMIELKIPVEQWKTETGAALLGDLCIKELIARMVCGVVEHAPNVYGRVFGNARDIEEALTADELAVLNRLCQQTMRELGPRLQVLTNSDVDAWIEILKAGLDPLAYLELPDLVELVRGFHRRIVTAEVSSTGSPTQDSQQESSLSTSESEQTTSATCTISSGEQQDLPSGGLTSDPLSPADALALARKMAHRE